MARYPSVNAPSEAACVTRAGQIEAGRPVAMTVCALERLDLIGHMSS